MMAHKYRRTMELTAPTLDKDAKGGGVGSRFLGGKHFHGGVCVLHNAGGGNVRCRAADGGVDEWSLAAS